MSLLAMFGYRGERLVERKLEGVGRIALPSSAKPAGDGRARDEDPSRLYFRFAHEYPWWVSMGSGTAYKQVLCVSLFAPTAAAAGYQTWPPRFEPLYRDLERERTVDLGNGALEISGGHYAQNALDETAHVYLYWDRSRRLQIAWHVADKVVAPDDAVKLIERMASSFELHRDPFEKLVEPAAAAPPAGVKLERFAFGIDLKTGDVYLDSLRRRLAAAAFAALPCVRAGDFEVADAAVLAVDRDIQAAVMLGAMYTAELRAAVARGERESRPEFVAALYERALNWRLSAYPEPHTAYEAADWEAGRAADRAELDAVLSAARNEGGGR